MSKREKVILVIMVIVVFCGIYSLFFSSPKETYNVGGGEKSGTLNKLMTGISKDLGEEKKLGYDTYIIERAEANWAKDPFYNKKISLVDAAYKGRRTSYAMPKEAPLYYSGYIEMGKKRFAIINGMEYQTGEELEQGGYIVGDIYGNKVVIEIKGTHEKLLVPMEEEVL